MSHLQLVRQPLRDVEHLGHLIVCALRGRCAGLVCRPVDRGGAVPSHVGDQPGSAGVRALTRLPDGLLRSGPRTKP